MLFCESLENLIFCRHQLITADEIIIVSGYVGPNPVGRLTELPLNATVIYGMYGEAGIAEHLHNSLLRCQNNNSNTNIYYSKIAVHSKCYVWKLNGAVIHALLGSANFSSNGLSTPYREVLAETTVDTFSPLNEYIKRILNNSVLCTDVQVTPETALAPRRTLGAQLPSDICQMTLLGTKNTLRSDRGEVPYASGLNWGHSLGHVSRDDAYIPILAEYVGRYPDLFPLKQNFPTISNGRGRATRHNDKIDIIWDDRTPMEGLLEGNRPSGNWVYPKQISSFPEKSILGKYIRRRLGLPSGELVTRTHLEAYGRTHIDISLLGEGIYYFDFSVNT